MKAWKRLFSRAAENGVFWMIIFLGTIGFLSLFSAGRQAIRAGSGRVKAAAEGRNHKSGDQLLPICSVENGKRQIALTFEWSGGETGCLDEILEVLADCGTEAAFFAGSRQLYEQKEKLEEIAAAGHDLGVIGGKDSLDEELGLLAGNGLFRPIRGEFDDGLITSVCAAGYYPVCWDVDSEDWKDYGAEAIARQVLEHENLESGSIIRFHGAAKYTPQALKEIIPGLESMGYELVPLSKLMLRENYHISQAGRQEAAK